MKSGPPAKQTTTMAVTADKKNMKLRPKLSGKVLSIPKTYQLKLPHVQEMFEPTFEIFSKPVEQAATVDSVVETDFSKQHALKQPLVQDGGGVYRTRVQHEPPGCIDKYSGHRDYCINADIEFCITLVCFICVT
jgi:hypothetical protein